MKYKAPLFIKYLIILVLSLLSAQSPLWAIGKEDVKELTECSDYFRLLNVKKILESLAPCRKLSCNEDFLRELSYQINSLTVTNGHIIDRFKDKFLWDELAYLHHILEGSILSKRGKQLLTAKLVDYLINCRGLIDQIIQAEKIYLRMLLILNNAFKDLASIVSRIDPNIAQDLRSAQNVIELSHMKEKRAERLKRLLERSIEILEERIKNDGLLKDKDRQELQKAINVAKARIGKGEKLRKKFNTNLETIEDAPHIAATKRQRQLKDLINEAKDEIRKYNIHKKNLEANLNKVKHDSDREKYKKSIAETEAEIQKNENLEQQYKRGLHSKHPGSENGAIMNVINAYDHLISAMNFIEGLKDEYKNGQKNLNYLKHLVFQSVIKLSEALDSFEKTPFYDELSDELKFLKRAIKQIRTYLIHPDAWRLAKLQQLMNSRGWEAILRGLVDDLVRVCADLRLIVNPYLLQEPAGGLNVRKFAAELQHRFRCTDIQKADLSIDQFWVKNSKAPTICYLGRYFHNDYRNFYPSITDDKAKSENATTPFNNTMPQQPSSFQELDRLLNELDELIEKNLSEDWFDKIEEGLRDLDPYILNKINQYFGSYLSRKWLKNAENGRFILEENLLFDKERILLKAVAKNKLAHRIALIETLRNNKYKEACLLDLVREVYQCLEHTLRVENLNSLGSYFLANLNTLIPNLRDRRNFGIHHGWIEDITGLANITLKLRSNLMPFIRNLAQSQPIPAVYLEASLSELSNSNKLKDGFTSFKKNSSPPYSTPLNDTYAKKLESYGISLATQAMWYHTYEWLVIKFIDDTTLEYEYLEDLVPLVVKSVSEQSNVLRKVIKAICEDGADPNVCDLQGRSVLHLAAAEDDFPFISDLIAAGAIPDAVTIEGLTPQNSIPAKDSFYYHTALHLNQEKEYRRGNEADHLHSIIECVFPISFLYNLNIKDYLVNINLLDANGELVLIKGLRKGDKLEPDTFDLEGTIEYLLDHNADPALLDFWDRTAFHQAANSTNAQIYTLLAEKTDPAGVYGNIVHPTYEYRDWDVGQLLTLRLQEHLTDPGFILLAPLGGTDQGRHQVAEELQRIEEDRIQNGGGHRTVVIPYNVGNYHWIGLIIRVGDDGRPTVEYHDSLRDENGEPREPHPPLIDEIHTVYPEAAVTQINSLIQNDNYACGAYTVENLATALGVGGAIGYTNANTIRTQHFGLLQQYAEGARPDIPEQARYGHIWNRASTTSLKWGAALLLNWLINSSEDKLGKYTYR